MTPHPCLTDGEFRAFQEVIHREAGIWLADSKKALLTGRLSRRLRELGLPSFGAYLRHATEVAPEERVVMLDCICTNETRFFREPRQFDFIEQEVLPAWTAAAAAGGRPRRIRAWSAGCSTGEEPYSVAMALLAHCPPAAGWEIEVLATDLSTRALSRAESGVWRMEDASEIPSPYLRRFMLRGVRSQEGGMKAGDEIRRVLQFQRLNLARDDYPVSGSFDLVFCRNVLIYFDAAGKTRVLSRLVDRVSPGGYLFLGHAESLHPSAGWVGVCPNVYTRGARPGVRSPAPA